MERVFISSTLARTLVPPASSGGAAKAFCPRPRIGSPVSVTRSSIQPGPKRCMPFIQTARRGMNKDRLKRESIRAVTELGAAERPAQQWLVPLGEHEPDKRNHFVLFMKPELLAVRE